MVYPSQSQAEVATGLSVLITGQGVEKLLAVVVRSGQFEMIAVEDLAYHWRH